MYDRTLCNLHDLLQIVIVAFPHCCKCCTLFCMLCIICTMSGITLGDWNDAECVCNHWCNWGEMCICGKWSRQSHTCSTLLTLPCWREMMTSSSIKAECNGLSSLASTGVNVNVFELFRWRFCYILFSVGYNICAICFVANLKIYGEMPLNALPA